MIETIPQGTAILTVGGFATLTYATLKMMSPIGLLGWAASIMGMGLYLLDITGPVLMILTFMLHTLTLAATGVFDTIND